MKDVEDALQRLDNWTQEEARMAAVETLMIARNIDDTVRDVDVRLKGVDKTAQDVDRGVKGIDHKVGSVIQGQSFSHQPVPESVLSLLLD
jgi:hypothetical protein